MVTHTDRRRFPFIAAIAVLALAGAVLGLLFSPVQAQEAGTLLSNTGQAADRQTNTDDFYPAQGFITGSKAGGYVLTSIELDVATAPGTPSGATVELWSSMTMTDIDGNNSEEPEPDARLATLIHSTGTWDTGLNTFNAPADTQLGPNTTYFVFVSYAAPAPHLQITNTTSSSTDSGGASGWDLPDGGSILLEDGVWLAGPTSYLKFKVNGYELRNRPDEIRAYWTDFDPDNDSNNGNVQVGCSGTERFRAFWERPNRANEWEAELTPKYGASNVNFTMSNTGGKWPELTGTVRTNGFSTVSIRVRGRFGDDGWGAWSPVTSLLCLPPPPPPPTCPEDAGDVWCGVITVGEREGFYGFNRFQGTGELSDDDFDVGTNSYTIDILEVQGDSEEEDYGDLTFKLAERPDDAQQEALDELTLYLDNDPLSLSEADPGPPGFYYFDGADLDWSREDYIVARLRESSSEQRDDSSGQKKQSDEPASAPDKPRGLEATATHDSVTLTWDDPGDDSITGYVILRRIPGVDPQGHFDELVADTETAATTYTDDTVSAETRYTYRIKAINGAGTSERSRWSHIDVPAAPVPDKPTGLEATESHGQVVLTWDDPNDDSITGYVILRRVRVNNTGGAFSVLVADTGSAATTYTDDTVAAGTTYTYRIKAINEHGTSERSRWFHIDIPEAP